MKKFLFVFILSAMLLSSCQSSDNSSDNTSAASATTTTKITTSQKPETTTAAEARTSARVDQLCLQAKSDSKSADEKAIKKAESFLRDNIKTIFKDVKSMESTIYYGQLISDYYKSTNQELSDLGWQAVKTVKYVYSQSEKLTDDSTMNNYSELKDMANKLL